jgi:hypothetical protein
MVEGLAAVNDIRRILESEKWRDKKLPEYVHPEMFIEDATEELQTFAEKMEPCAKPPHVSFAVDDDGYLSMYIK